MKAGDIAVVRDGSYSMALIKGSLHPTNGDNLRPRRLRVLAVGGTYPTEYTHDLVTPNDTMLVDVNDPDFVVFTLERFCQVATPAPPSPAETMEVSVPHGTKRVVVTLR